jgi:hypothetical protein
MKLSEQHLPINQYTSLDSIKDVFEAFEHFDFQKATDSV